MDFGLSRALEARRRVLQWVEAGLSLQTAARLTVDLGLLGSLLHEVLHASFGDPTKAKKVLDWEAETSFDQLVRMMVDADLDFLKRVIVAAEWAGAHRFRYADTLGVLDPFETCSIFRTLCAETDLELEFHGHDDLGL